VTICSQSFFQPTQSKGSTFHLDKTFYVNGSFFFFDSYQDIKKAAPAILKQFARFGLTMHVGNDKSCSKTEGMFFPSTLNQAKQEANEEITPEDLYYTNGNKIHLTKYFKYLGSIITPEVTKDAEIT
jgi:hypothetical protein